MGYVPNRLAGSLTAGTSGLVAAIVPTLRHSLFADTLEGLVGRAGRGRARPHRLVERLSQRCRGKPDPLDPRAPPGCAGAHRPHPYGRGARALLRSFAIPVVETWESGDEPVDMAVGYSNREAAYAMTAELIRSGYRRIVFVNGPAEDNERARHAGGGVSRRRLPRPGSRPCRSISSMTRPRSCPRPAPRRCGRCGPPIRRSTRCSSPATCSPSAPCSPAATTGMPVPHALGIAGFHDLEIGRVVARRSPPCTCRRWRSAAGPAQMILSRLAGKVPAERRLQLDFNDRRARQHAPGRASGDSIDSREDTGNIASVPAKVGAAPKRFRCGTREEKRC